MLFGFISQGYFDLYIQWYNIPSRFFFFWVMSTCVLAMFLHSHLCLSFVDPWTWLTGLQDLLYIFGSLHFMVLQTKPGILISLYFWYFLMMKLMMCGATTLIAYWHYLLQCIALICGWLPSPFLMVEIFSLLFFIFSYFQLSQLSDVLNVSKSLWQLHVYHIIVAKCLAKSGE